MMDPVVAPLRARLERAELRVPLIPILSTVTADWLTDEQAEPAPHFVAAEYSGARPEGLLGLNFQLIAQLDESSFQPSMSCVV